MKVIYQSAAGLEKTASAFQNAVVLELLKLGIEPDEILVPLDDAASLSIGFSWGQYLGGIFATQTPRVLKFGAHRGRVSVVGFIGDEAPSTEELMKKVKIGLKTELESLVVDRARRIGFKVGEFKLVE